MQAYTIKKTSPSWDSFRKTLSRALLKFNPEYVFEYGPGESTMLMAFHPSIKLIESVEHNVSWFDKYQDLNPSKVIIHLCKSQEEYTAATGRRDKYDLIFIDGVFREICLEKSKQRLTKNGFVILHDAERPQYIPFINLYKYKFFEDDGHTVLLTDSTEVADKWYE